MSESAAIRPVTRDEAADEVFALCRELLGDGTTYVFRPDTSRDELLDYWFPDPGATYAAEIDGEIKGCYLLRPNHPDRGSHVANASYFVSTKARGAGLGRKMAEHSIEAARAAGYRAMQFNLVVVTNENAIKLWESLGFDTIGVVPQAFDHAELGLVDALIMHRLL